MADPERCPACGELDCECALYHPDDPDPSEWHYIEENERTPADEGT